MIIKVIIIKDSDELTRTQIEVKESRFDKITALEAYYSNKIDKLMKEGIK